MRVEDQYRRAGWFGLKQLTAQALSLPGVNEALLAIGRLALPRHHLYRLPMRARRTEYRLESGACVTLLEPRTDQVAKDIYWGGGVPTGGADRHILRWVEHRARDADLFVDIGTYSGLFAMIAARANPRLRAIAFDILPENYLMAARNIIENDLVGRIDLRLCGLAEAESKVIMPRSSSIPSHPSGMSLGAGYRDGVTIPVRPLDTFGLGGRMLWKIDVETYEWSVVQGAADTIRRHKPDIVCEILPRFTHSVELQTFLEPLGYRFFIALESGFEQRPTLAPDRAGRDWVLTTGDSVP